MARQCPAEAGDTVKARVCQNHHLEPPDEILRPHAISAVKRPEKPEGQHIAQQHRDKPGQHGGEVHRLPPQGQGIHEPAVAREVEVAEYCHRHERTGEEGAPRKRLSGNEQILAQTAHVADRLCLDIVRVRREHGERQHRQPRKPERPEAPQQMQAHAPVKEGCS